MWKIPVALWRMSGLAWPLFPGMLDVAMEMHLWEAQAGNLEMLPLPWAMEAFHLLEGEMPPPFPKQSPLSFE